MCMFMFYRGSHKDYTYTDYRPPTKHIQILKQMYCSVHCAEINMTQCIKELAVLWQGCLSCHRMSCHVRSDCRAPFACHSAPQSGQHVDLTSQVVCNDRLTPDRITM